jgi:hypothetical protein
MRLLKPALKGGLSTVLTLFGGLALGLLAGSLVFELIPGSSVEDVRIGHAAIAAVPALAGLLAGGAAWGVQMGRMAGFDHWRRMAWAGMLGFAPLTITLAVILGLAEPFLVAQFSRLGQPIHRVFTLLFTPSAFLIAAASAWAVGHGLKDPTLARWLSWRVGFAVGITFLLVNLVMEAQGWVVGAPGAAERATMLTVLFLGLIGSALVGGAIMGAKLP